MDQLGLDFAPPHRGRAVRRPIIPKPEETIDDRFVAFHAANPDVYEELRALALSGARRGLRRLGIKSLFEVVRWNRALATRGEPWKLNNDFTSRYSRLLMDQEPELDGIFELRALQEGES